MKKIIVLITMTAMLCLQSNACPLCNRQVQEAIYNSRFYPNLFTMLSAFMVLAVIVLLLAVITGKHHKRRIAAYPSPVVILSPVPLTTASVILGIGLGGFIDGIVLHQVLQVHEMLSNKIPSNTYVGKSVNMFWDGIFHAFCLVVTLTGIILLWKVIQRNDVNRSGRLLAAGLLSGWGVFNIVEGVIDHQLLQLHNVIEYAADHNTGNYIFLGISVLMLLAGCALMRSVYIKSYLKFQ